MTLLHIFRGQNPQPPGSRPLNLVGHLWSFVFVRYRAECVSCSPTSGMCVVEGSSTDERGVVGRLVHGKLLSADNT